VTKSSTVPTTFREMFDPPLHMQYNIIIIIIVVHASDRPRAKLYYIIMVVNHREFLDESLKKSLVPCLAVRIQWPHVIANEENRGRRADSRTTHAQNNAGPVRVNLPIYILYTYIARYYVLPRASRYVLFFSTSLPPPAPFTPIAFYDQDCCRCFYIILFRFDTTRSGRSNRERTHCTIYSRAQKQ